MSIRKYYGELLTVIAFLVMAALAICPVSERQDEPDPLECQALKVWYLDFNEQYFMGVLPRNAVVEYGNAHGAMATTFKVGGVFHIVLEKKYTLANKVAHEVLLHESCHVISWSEKEEHSRRWHDCIHRLEEQGAFENLL